MNLFAALLLMTVAAEPANTSDQGEEIIVIGEKLKSWRGTIRTHDGQQVCKTTKSTGDKAIDAIGCGAMLACFAPEQERLDALQKSSKDAEEYRRVSEPVFEAIGACLAEKRSAGVDAFVKQRRGS
jgi:hypothetical protein